MRILAYVALVATLAAPARATAQTPTRAGLVGMWVRTQPGQSDSGKQATEVDTLVLYPDSTWTLQVVNPGGARGNYGLNGCTGWLLSGDSLWFGPPAAPTKIYGKTVVTGRLPTKITLHDQELTIEVPQNPKDKSPKVFKRVGDAGKPPQCRR